MGARIYVREVDRVNTVRRHRRPRRSGGGRKLLCGACLLGALWFLLPVGIGSFHIGMVYPAGVLVYLAVCALSPRWFLRLPRWLRAVGNMGVGVVIAVSVVVSGMMLRAAEQAPPEEGPVTVVVLGCQTIDERPSLTLQRRIEAAYAYLTAHEEAVCICTGGIDDNETMAEGAVAARVLREMGIAPERLYIEDASRNTEENLRFAGEIIAENGLPETVAVSTDTFHQYRGAYWAREVGLQPYALPCGTHWYLAGALWCRDIVAILALALPR